ncbi:C2 [Horseradish curly top virus]|uniref:C2 protein n=1 Tax=Horseradish curly top virus TaxID=46448 RepID=Q68542_9GEMI|nr:hypothetical protein [Horseradish curly top virus]AAB18925.1 C2 [Horseradish curly top virus]
MPFLYSWILHYSTMESIKYSIKNLRRTIWEIEATKKQPDLYTLKIKVIEGRGRTVPPGSFMTYYFSFLLDRSDQSFGLVIDEWIRIVRILFRVDDITHLDIEQIGSSFNLALLTYDVNILEIVDSYCTTLKVLF